MRIHIVCPSDEPSGSAESLHQFGRAAATLGYDTRIAYGGDPIFGAVPSAFRPYGLRNDQDVADGPDVLALAAHTDVAALEHLGAAHKLVWWLRLDPAAEAEVERALAVPGAIHLAQSEYARRFLAERGVEAKLVGDYVARSFVDRASAMMPAEKLNTVLYNADATDAFTPQLIAASQGVLQWVPVTGLSRDDVAELMAYSKIYVDFGAHAGRTRLPREALAAGCVVVTGRRGAAGNSVDLALPDGFQFDETDASMLSVLDRIALSVMDFDSADAAFEPARAIVLEQEVEVRGQVSQCLAHVLSERGLASEIKQPRRAVAAIRRPAADAPTSTPPVQPAPMRSDVTAPPRADDSITVVIATIPPRVKLLRRALDSVIAQTLSPAAVVVEWDHRKTGAAATKNRAIEKVNTEWVAFLDDDDAFLPEHLSKLHACAVENDADVVYPMPRAEAKARSGIPALRFGMPFDADELRRAPYIPNTVLARTDLVQKVGGFECAPGTVWDDYGLFLKLLAVGAKFVHLPEVTWIWNQLGQGTAGVPDLW
ncbi:MAG TPA: glycosyltransferase [Jatrophihabitantaceae bacterium]|nr:glycosyltransferase [Jatrophihabitantaceae bacterium]